jgi:hypothetical protein
MLNRWLPGSYGGAGNVVNKQAVIELAVKEVASHAVLVQGELDKQKHERELAVNRSNAGRRAPGKLRRLRGAVWSHAWLPLSSLSSLFASAVCTVVEVWCVRAKRVARQHP